MQLSGSGVTLKVGYFGKSANKKASRAPSLFRLSDTQLQGVCANISTSASGKGIGEFCMNDLDFNQDEESLKKEFVDEANIEDDGSKALGDMLRFAGAFRANSFPHYDAVAPMILLIFGAVISLVAVFLKSDHRTKVFSILLGVCALALGFGLMTAGGAFFNTWRLQNLFNRFENDRLLDDAFKHVTFKTGDVLWILSLGALTTNGVFVILITWSAYLQTYPRKFRGEEKGPLLGGFQPARYKAPKFGKKRKSSR